MFRALSRSARLTRTVHHRGIPLNGVRVGSFSTLSFRPIPSSRPSYRPHLAPLALNAVPPLSRGYALRLDPVPKFNSVADLNKFMTQLEDFLKTGAQLVRTQEDIISTYESLLQVLWWNFRSVAYLAREISRRSSATGTAARRGFDPYILNVHERFKLTSLELKKLVENSMTTLEESTEAISHSSTLRAGIESAIRFTKTEMSKLEAQKVALNKDIEDSKNKLRDSERASRNLHINMALMERNRFGRMISDFADAFRAQRSSWEHQMKQGMKELERMYQAQQTLERRLSQKTDELKSIKDTKDSLDSMNSKLNTQSGELKKTLVQFRGVQDKCITQKDRISKLYVNYVMKMETKASLIETSFGTNELAKVVVEVTLLGMRSPENGAVAEHVPVIADYLSKLDQSTVEAEDEDDPFALGDTSLADKLAELKREAKSTRYSHFVLENETRRRPE